MSSLRLSLPSILISLPALAAWIALPQQAAAYEFDGVEDDYQDLYLATPVALTGRVVDAQGLPLVNASLELIAFGDALANDGEAASSAVGGSFDLPGLARRSALVRVSLAGYYSEVLPVDLQVAMDEPTVDLGDVTLVAKQFDRARLSFGGDAMFGRRFFDEDEDGVLGESEDLLHAATLGADTRALFRFVEDVLHTDDHTAINLETPVTDAPATPHPNKSYVFFAYSASAAELPGVGVDSVSLGNNHIYDYLEAGVADTLTHLDAIGLPYYGAAMSPAAAAATTYRPDINGVPLSLQGFSNFVGYSYGGDAYKVIALDSPQKGGAHPSFSSELNDFVDTETASGRMAIPIIHGGTEYAYAQSSGTRSDFERTIDHGASMAIGHHPHVAHGVSTFDAGDGPAYVLGSLGNLVFDQEIYETMRSYLAVVDVVDGGSGLSVERLQLVPYRLDGYVPRLLTGVALDRMGRHVAHISTAEAAGETPGNGWGSATVFSEGGRLVVTPTEAAAVTTDLVDQRSPALVGGSTGALALDPYTGTDALAALSSDVPATCEVGRNLLVNGDFEDSDVDDAYQEGDLWRQSSARYIQGSETHSGTTAAVLLRRSSNSGRTSLYMGSNLEIEANHDMTISGFIKGRNAGELQVTVRWMSSGGSTVSHTTQYQQFASDYDWTQFQIDVTAPSNADKLKVYFRHYPPASGGDGEVFLDDVNFIDWDEDALSVDAGGTQLATPNSWDFVRCEAPGESLDLDLTHRVYESQ